jgi:hypothetical protein
VVDKVESGQVYSKYKTVHSTNFSILTIIRGRYNRPGVAAVPSGPSIDSTPPNIQIKKKCYEIFSAIRLIKYERNITSPLIILLIFLEKI